MNAVNTANTKASLFSVLPAPAVSTDLSSQTDLTAKADSGTGKSFDSALDKAREQSAYTKQAESDSGPAGKDDPVKDQVKNPEETDDADDKVKTAVKSGQILTLLTSAQPIQAEPETEQPLAVQDPVADPVEAVAGVEAIGQEAGDGKSQTPLAAFQNSGNALAELLPDSATAGKDAALLNQLSGRYDGEVTIGEMAPVKEGDPQNIEGLLANAAAPVPDGLAAITAATAGRAMGLKQVQTEPDNQQPLVSARNLVTEEQILDDSPALGLSNVKVIENAQSSLAGNMTQTPQQELSQAIGLREEQLKERLSDTEGDPEDKRTAIPQGILDDAGAKNPELYLTKAARRLGVRPEAEDRSQPLAVAAGSQSGPVEIQPEQVQPQTARTTDVYDIRQQILEQVRMIRTAQTTELVMQLKPEHLGQLTMRVSVANNGSVTAVFQSENAQVRAAIESQITQLKQELQQQGLKVDDVSVGAGLSEDFFTRSETQGQMGQFAQQGQQAGSDGASRRADRTGAVDSIEGTVTVENSGAGAISTDAANPVNNATDTILDYRV